MKGIISSHSALTAYQRQLAVAPVNAPESAAPQEATASSTSVGAARVSISAQGRALGAAEAPIDQAKVERLRNAIQAGTFKLDPQVIAQRMLERGE